MEQFLSMLANQPQGQQSILRSHGLVEFKAGKLNRDGHTKLVKPDPRKGLFYMDVEDDLLHLYWKPRNASEPEDDLIIFPEDAEFERVSQCTTGRVYALKFRSSSAIHFFWMQSKDESDDERLCNRVNALIADPTSQEHDIEEDEDDEDEANARRLLEDQLRSLGADSQNGILQQLLGGVGGGPQDSPLMARSRRGGPGYSSLSQLDPDAIGVPPPAMGTTGPSDSSDARLRPTGAGEAASGDNFANFRNILSNIRVPREVDPIDEELTDVLSPPTLAPLLADPETRASLFPHLPQTGSFDTSEESIREVIASPPFQQSLRSLSRALRTGQMTPLLRNLGLEVEEGQSVIGVKGFLEAMERQLRRQQNENSGDSMDTD
ncbi:hypothetical protein G7K_6270-t1 [Saitoella complicata NRRL Y-17804]|uniref:Uncharacterized protein n=2 Tax=Saitoella complicata (strain BCRC 22490 / CBS 7301 / JCM 7358 / NBRC 10748 / NRRL Y-17804) TaxID=698492 RepID=A0A0E9NQM9_SAICN|nr:hypothetical protein G7K_6270-t1 [Saitoella complicata NRRL Y-17804]